MGEKRQFDKHHDTLHVRHMAQHEMYLGFVERGMKVCLSIPERRPGDTCTLPSPAYMIVVDVDYLAACVRYVVRRRQEEGNGNQCGTCSMLHKVSPVLHQVGMRGMQLEPCGIPGLVAFTHVPMRVDGTH